MSCFPCEKPDPCKPCEEVSCEQVICNNCYESYQLECVFSSKVLSCTNGTFKIEKGLSADQIISQLICKINELEAKVNFLLSNTNTGACDIPTFITATES